MVGTSKSYLATGPKKSRWSGSCGFSRLRSGVTSVFLVVEKIGGLQPGASFQDMFPVWDVSVSTLRLGGRCDDSRTQEMGGEKSTKIIKGYTVKGICHFTYIPFWEPTNPPPVWHF